MPWASAQKSKNAVRGCYGAAGGNRNKRRKCRKLAHEARVWRDGRKKGAIRSAGMRSNRRGSKRRASRRR